MHTEIDRSAKPSATPERQTTRASAYGRRVVALRRGVWSGAELDMRWAQLQVAACFVFAILFQNFLGRVYEAAGLQPQ